MVDDTSALDGGARAFDYLAGDWRIRHRIRIPSSGQWLTTEGPFHLDHALDGSANIDRAEVAALPPHPFIGSSIRIYDPDADTWTIGWIDNLSHQFGAFVTGPMRGGRGDFRGVRSGTLGEELVHFRWRFRPPDRAHWFQAVSTDNGRTWRPTWLMWFRRA